MNRGIRTTTARSSLIRGAETVVLALPHLRREEQRRPDEGLGASERVLHGLRDAEVRELGVPALWASVARRTQERPRGSVKTNGGKPRTRPRTRSLSRRLHLSSATTVSQMLAFRTLLGKSKFEISSSSF